MKAKVGGLDTPRVERPSVALLAREEGLTNTRPVANKQNPSRRHHYVPQFLLRRFARDGKLLARVERAGNHGVATPKSVCWEEDLYTLDGPGYVDPAWIEHHSDEHIEAPASRALNAIVGPGGFPPERVHREALARFVAWQFLRGPDGRAFINTPVRFAVELLSRNLDRLVTRERLAGLLNGIGLPIDASTGELRKDPLLAFQTRTADRLAETVLAMRLALVRFPELALITSDRPVVQWGKIGLDTQAYGVGLDVPHALSLHIDPRHALLFVPPWVCGEMWEERVVDGTPEHAEMLNARVAQWAWARVFHHPDHAPLNGRPLAPWTSFDDELRATIESGVAARPWPIRTMGRWLFRSRG